MKLEKLRRRGPLEVLAIENGQIIARDQRGRFYRIRSIMELYVDEINGEDRDRVRYHMAGANDDLRKTLLRVGAISKEESDKIGTENEKYIRRKDEEEFRRLKARLRK